jgi:hypothetical protein
VADSVSWACGTISPAVCACWRSWLGFRLAGDLDSGALARPRARPNAQPGSAQQPSSELGFGDGRGAQAQKRVLPKGASGSPRPQATSMSSGGGGGHLLGHGGSGGDGRVPRHALGDDDEQLAQQRGGCGGAGLPVGELVDIAAGEQAMPGRPHRVVRQGAPDRAPGRGAQAGPSAAGDAGLAAEVPRLVGPRREPGMLDPGPGRVVPVGRRSQPGSPRRSPPTGRGWWR